MNAKIYWSIRQKLLTIIFEFKKIIYFVFKRIFSFYEFNSFRVIIFKQIVKTFLKTILAITIIVCLDDYLSNKICFPLVDNSIIVPTVIAGIGIAGIIVGLYCANIASVYSSRYANAPKIIAQAFQKDKVSQYCIFQLVEYIVFGFLLIGVILAKEHISWVTVFSFISFSIVVIISYAIAGNRAYELSDIYKVATDSNRILYNIITKYLNRKLYATDKNYQNHFYKEAQRQVDLLKTIQKYGEGIKRTDNVDNSTMVEFMCNNLTLVYAYWENKRCIARTSLWFRKVPKYSKWHLANDSELSAAIKTGTSLPNKEEFDYWWLEDELFGINKNCLENLLKQHDYSSIYSYLLFFNKLSATAIESKEANYFMSQIEWIKQSNEKFIDDTYKDNIYNNNSAGVIDIISILYLSLILESNKYFQRLNIKDRISETIKAIDSGIDADKNKVIRSRQDLDFYRKIITEVKVEGKRITPDWVVGQQIAKEEYVYMNSLLDILNEGMNHIFNLGNTLFNKELYTEACIVLTKFYEYESKLNRLIKKAIEYKDNLEIYHIDKSLKWDKYRLGNLQKTLSEWKKQIPKQLSDCSIKFTLGNWENREECPDFLGECYNHICEDAIEAIKSGDKEQFGIDFDNLSKLMLIYQEYIRTDFIKNKDLYRIEYAYYMFTSPIVEFAQIGGLAILWGEFHEDMTWKECVIKSNKLLLGTDKEGGKLAERLIEYIQNRDSFMFGIADRDILETGWKQEIENTIRDSGICETEFDMFYQHLKTNSELLKAFCPNFMDYGFTIDPSEVYWVTAINPFISVEKRYRSRFHWEDKIDD